MLNIEEAINDAIDKVITKVINYWNSDLKNGIQYKTIIQISSEFDNEEIEEIQFSLMDAMDNMVNESEKIINFQKKYNLKTKSNQPEFWEEVTEKIKLRFPNFDYSTCGETIELDKDSELATLLAEVWEENNPWFGEDEAMTYTALSIHKKLLREEGFDGKSDLYYDELNKRIRKEFPHKFEDENKKDRPAQAVASANRSIKSGRRTVKLTPSQVAIAKKLGVPLTEYAKYANKGGQA